MSVLRLTALTFLAFCTLSSSTAFAAETGKPFVNRLGDELEKIVPPENAPVLPGFPQKTKGDVTDPRTISEVVGIACMDAVLALRVQQLLNEGKESEALNLRSHKTGKPECEVFAGFINHETGKIEIGKIVPAKCSPLSAPQECFVVITKPELPTPLELEAIINLKR